MQLLAANASAGKKAPASAAVSIRAAEPVATARVSSGSATPDSRFVVGRVVFDNSPQNNFFITTKLTVVQQMNKGLKVVGKISETDSEDFPFVITSPVYSSLLISETGIVVDKKGRRVGKLAKA